MNIVPTSRIACSEVRELSGAYVDDELFAGAGQQVHRHLNSCNACKALVGETVRLKHAVQGAVRRDRVPVRVVTEIKRLIRAHSVANPVERGYHL